MSAVPQSQFRAAMLDPATAVPAGLANPDGTQAGKRFDVYRNNVAVGLSDALEAAFPVVRKLVGADFFRAMAGVYLRKHPPTSPLMMFYGAAMPRFLSRFPPTKGYGYLPDIAQLELAIRRAYHAADATAIDPAALAALPPEDLMGARLDLAPAIQVIVSDYPVHAIYLANTTENAPKPVMQPQSVLVTRPSFDPQLHAVNQDAAAMILALKEGQTLGQAVAGAKEDRDIGAVLGLLLSQGAITKIKTKGPTQ